MDFMQTYIIHNLIQLMNKSIYKIKKIVYILYIHYLDAGVVQWLVYGLANAITLGQTLAIKLAINNIKCKDFNEIN